MKPHTSEYIEGPGAARRFHAAMKAVIAVPHGEIQKRIAEHKAMAALNPRKRGPKPKRKSVSHDPAV